MENTAKDGRIESGERYPARATELVLGDFLAREPPPSRPASPLSIALASLASLAMIAVAIVFAVTDLRARVPKPVVPATVPTETPTPLPITVTEAPAASASPSVVASTPRVIARPRVRVASSAPPATTMSAAPTATLPKTKCCPGESEMACHMRIAVGGSCG